MLVLFDVDKTLISTGYAGRGAMERAGRRLFGEGFSREGVAFAGRLDPVIVDDLLARNGVEPTPQRRAAFRRAYLECLDEALRTGSGECRPLPGVADLLAGVERAGWTLGLLTGNFEETGRLKLAACGLDADRFPIRVWGDECPGEPCTREQLVAVGLRRWERRRGKAAGAADAVIVGDTIHDVACGRAHGVRVLGVATGEYGMEALLGAGADLALETLEDTRRVLDWIAGRASSGGR